MKRTSVLVLIAIVGISGLAYGSAGASAPQRGRQEPPPDLELMSAQDVLSATPPLADQRIAYGSDPVQFGDLRLPEGSGPHPVAIMIHGGCWMAFADLEHFGVPAAELTRNGIATWSVEYRRVDMEGGGWPNTFLDVGAGMDHLREIAAEYDLDLERAITVGHSAGGHLALWAAGRHRIEEDSDLYVADPLPVIGVVSLGGAPELRRTREIDENVCGMDVIDTLMGGAPDEVPERYLAGSPFQMLPLDVTQRHITGQYDMVVPRQQVNLYNYEASQVDDSELIVAPNAGHFEVMWPGTEAWAIVEREVFALLGMDR